MGALQAKELTTQSIALGKRPLWQNCATDGLPCWNPESKELRFQIKMTRIWWSSGLIMFLSNITSVFQKLEWENSEEQKSFRQCHVAEELPGEKCPTTGWFYWQPWEIVTLRKWLPCNYSWIECGFEAWNYSMLLRFLGFGMMLWILEGQNTLF